MAQTKSTPELDLVDGLAQISFLIVGLLEAKAAAHDLSLVQIRLLGILRDRRPTMAQLAALLGTDKSSLTGLVDRAERRGLVARRASADDGRVITVELTDAGRTAVAAAAAEFALEVSAIVAPLSGRDRNDLRRLLDRMVVGQAVARGLDLALDPGAG